MTLSLRLRPKPYHAGAARRSQFQRSGCGLFRPSGQRLWRSRFQSLTPECDPGCRTIRYLSDQGIVVSAGHSDAPLEQLRAAVDAGVSMFTHVGNGCPGSLPRHDNVIQRALSLRDSLWLCFIADGVHVPFFALANYLRLAGDRAIVVTDAMAAAGLGPGRYTIGRWDVDVDQTLAVWAPNKTHLLGSAVTMHRAEENLRKHLGLGESKLRQLTRDRAVTSLGLQ